MAVSRDVILDLVSQIRGKLPSEAEEQDLFGLFGIDGHDACELLEVIEARAGVQLEGYYWYFHQHDEPPMGRRVVPVAVDGKVLPMVPVSVDTLLAAAQTGVWPITYPPHRVHDRGWYFLAAAVAMVFIPLLLIVKSQVGSYGVDLERFWRKNPPCAQTSDRLGRGISPCGGFLLSGWIAWVRGQA
ncbi:MAG: hypothetical protein NTX73_10660 [Rhodobacterales bacterium]|nr:hypothetical protein [Rhodobacterales bacterium]